jgi:hypothetical protein
MIYQHNPNPETAEETRAPIQWSNRSGAVSVTLTDGEATTQTRTNEKYSSADLGKDTFGADDWRSTARNRYGNPTTTITEDAVVTIGGVQGRVADFVRSGLLHETAAGVFEEAPEEAPQEEQEQADPHAAVMPEEVRQSIDGALEPVPDHALDAVLSAGVRVAAGAATVDAIVSQVVSSSGIDPADARERTEFVISAYQQQADAYLTNRAGIAKEDLAGFYDAARSNPGLLQEAIRTQVRGSMEGWKRIADGYVSKTAPSAAALEAAGYPTRNLSGTPEVFIGGMWCSVHGAARAGLL